MGGLSSQKGVLYQFFSFNHLDFHLFNEITKCFPFPVCQALGWVLGYGRDHHPLPPSGISLGVGEEAVLTDNCPMAGAMESEAQMLRPPERGSQIGQSLATDPSSP